MVINRQRYRIIPQYEKARRQVKARNTTRTAVLGDETQNIYSDRIGYYYARPIMGADDNGNALLGPTFYLRANPAAGIMPRPGFKVFYKRNERDQDVIVSADLDDLEQKKVDARALEANDPYRAHRYLFELVNLKSEGIDSDLLVNCYPWQYQTSDNTVHFFGGTTATTHVDLEDNDFIGPSAVTAGRTSIMPTVANTRRFALLVFNITKHLADDYPLEVYPGVAQTIAPDDPLTINIDLQTCYDVLPTDEIIIPIKAYYLEHGQTEIAGISKDIDVRQFINVPSLPITITSEDESVTIVEDPVGTFDLSVASSGGMESFTLAGDSGTSQTVENGETVTITGGTGLSSVAGATNTVTLNLDNTTVAPGEYTYATVTVDAQGRITDAESGVPGMTFFSLNADAGTPEVVNEGDSMSLIGASMITTEVSAPDTVTVKIAPGNSVSTVIGFDADANPYETANAVDIFVIWGETVAHGQCVYKKADNKWWKMDADGALVGRERGVVIGANGTLTADNLGIVRRQGRVDGYSGLTDGAAIYVSNTTGAFTQTEPTPSLDGAMVIIACMGHAIAPESIYVDDRFPVIYRQYVTSSAGETTTITHHANVPSQSRTFSARTYVYDEVSIETYASSNESANKQLKGQSGAGSTTTVDTAGAATFVLGDSGGTDFQVAQSFTVTAAGQFSSFTVQSGATTGMGSPATVTWTLYDNSGAIPGAVLATGTMPAWVASSTNTGTVTNGPFLVTGTTYWLGLSVPIQATNNFYTVLRNAGNPYANGQMKADQTTGASFLGSWNSPALAAGNDMRCAITVSAVILYDRIAQGFSHSSGATLLSVKLWLRKVASATGNLKLSIFSDTSSLPNTLITNGDSDVIDASTLGTSYAWVTFTFSTPPSISASTPYHMVLSTTGSASNTNYVEWGIDTSSPSYANGVLTSDTGGTWSTATPAADAIFDVIAQGTQSEEDLSLGQYTGGTGQYGVRRGSSTGTNPSTQTTFKNISGESMPIVYDVYVP